ncbi:hypothetical protein [Streptosporangium sp. NPDC003464]
MTWQAPWGRGFPGWHIECSAMSLRFLGERLRTSSGSICAGGTAAKTAVPVVSRTATQNPASQGR